MRFSVDFFRLRIPRNSGCSFGIVTIGACNWKNARKGA